jgi:3-oxoadipate enol-lactonase
MTTWLDANGVSLRYSWSGRGRQTLVLLHEMGGCLESWDAVVAELSPHVRTLAYDARGAGSSEKPVGALKIEHLTGDLRGLLDAVSERAPVILAGCAVGAAVAIRFAVQFPERVAGLFLLAPATGLTAGQRPAILDLAARIEAEGMRARIEERFDLSYPHEFFLGRTDRQQVRSRLLNHDPAAYARAYRMLCDLDLSGDLPRINVPTRVIAGARDKTRPAAVVERIAAIIPNARYEVIDSGHAMHILSPTLVAARILDFLREEFSTKGSG